MPRVPNFIGSQSPWGQALSNLGTALFGDPSEQLRQQQAEQEMEYRTEQIADIRMKRQLATKEAERIAAARLRASGGGGATPTTAPTAPTAPASVGDPEVAAMADQALQGQQTQLAKPFIEEQPPQAQPYPITQLPAQQRPTYPTTAQLPAQPVTPTAPPSTIQTEALGPVQPAASPVQQADYTPVAATTGADAVRKALTGPIGFYDALGLVESGDKWNIGAETSTAEGRYQFIGTPERPGTAQAVAKRLGLPLDQRLWTPEQQQMAIEYLTDENLQRARRVLGHEPTSADLYALHHFGGGAGSKIISAPSTELLVNIVGPDAMDANGYPHDMTVGDFYDRYGSRFGMGSPFEGMDTAALTPEQEAELFGGPDPTQAATAALTLPSQKNPELAAAHPELASVVDVQHQFANRPEAQYPLPDPPPPVTEADILELAAQEAAAMPNGIAGGAGLDTMGAGGVDTLAAAPTDAAPVPQPAVSAAAQPAPQQASLADSDMFSAADQVAEGIAPEMPGDVSQAAQTAVGGGPVDVFSQLDDYDRAILEMTPDDKFDEVLAKILTDKQKMARGGGGDGWLGGEGLEAQMYNTVVAYELKRKQGLPTTPAEDLQYQMAVAKLEEAKFNAQTGEVTQTKLPHGWTPETSPSPELDEGATGTQAAQDATTTAPAQPGEVRVVGNTMYGAVKEVVNADGSTTRRIGNMEITLPPGAGAKLSIEDSAKVAGLQNGVAELSYAANIIAPGGKIDRSQLASGTINLDAVADLGIGQGLPWTKGRSARQAILRSIEGVKRAYTGAALTGSEKVDFDSMFVPSYWDDDTEVLRKLAALDNWIKSTYVNFAKGRPQYAAVGTPGADQWWAETNASVAPAQQQQQQTTTPTGSADDPDDIRQFLHD